MLVGLVPHLQKPQALAACRDLINWLEGHKIRPCFSNEVGGYLGRPEYGVDEKEMAKAQLLVVLGGDGTLLSVVRHYAAWEIPILGINLGKLGFLSEVELADMYVGMERVLRGDFSVQERMLLQVKVLRAGCQAISLRALNDIVVSKGAFSRMLELGIDINGQSLTCLPADGVIVATPTGSTAYSLSAGGPIVDPDIEVLLLTPICPHSLHSRPVVISPASTLSITVNSRYEDVLLTIDGQESFPLQPEDQVVVSKADKVARLIKVKDFRFYDVLRQKLGTPLRNREGEV